MKKMILAGLTVVTLGIGQSMGVASAQEVFNNVGNQLPSPAFTYSVPNG